jgi:hypothetical protein
MLSSAKTTSIPSGHDLDGDSHSTSFEVPKPASAQRLNRECAEYLRYLHDPHGTRFAMVLAGGDGCWETIRREPMLHSRVNEPVFFRALSDEAVLQTLPNYHAMYERTPPELLLWINQERCRGILRHWSAFTASAAEQLQRHGQATLSKPIADLVLQRAG